MQVQQRAGAAVGARAARDRGGGPQHRQRAPPQPPRLGHGARRRRHAARPQRQPPERRHSAAQLLLLRGGPALSGASAAAARSATAKGQAPLVQRSRQQRIIRNETSTRQRLPRPPPGAVSSAETITGSGGAAPAGEAGLPCGRPPPWPCVVSCGGGPPQGGQKGGMWFRNMTETHANTKPWLWWRFVWHIVAGFVAGAPGFRFWQIVCRLRKGGLMLCQFSCRLNSAPGFVVQRAGPALSPDQPGLLLSNRPAPFEAGP